MYSLVDDYQVSSLASTPEARLMIGQIIAVFIITFWGLASGLCKYL